MIRNDFMEIANEYLMLWWGAPEAHHVCVRDGKFIYIAKGAVLQVENSVTAQWPDFLMTTEHFKQVYEWICHQPGDENIQFKLTSQDVQVHCGNAVIAVPRADKEASIYGDIEEVFLRPLLVNKYSFKIDPEQWSHMTDSVACAHKNDEDIPYLPVVTITITDEAVVLSTVSPKNVRAKAAIKIETGYAHHKEWENNYLISSFVIDPYPRPDITISFTENQAKQRSPLMIQYENGFTLVASPMWV